MPFGTTGIKLIDFVAGIQKKFNLVIQQNKNKLSDFIIEPFTDWYKQGNIVDFNQYINLNSNIEVIPANNLAVQNLNFGDTLDGDYISQQFSKGAAREFGKAYYVDTENFFSQGDFTVKTTLASSPLIYLAGTGVSGSQTGGPIAFYVGDCQLSTANDLEIVCQYGIKYPIYSSTGILEDSAVLYFDEYGLKKVVGYDYIVDNDHDCKIWKINSLTGIITYDTYHRCAEFGGCI
jgi:hypothetical protein